MPTSGENFGNEKKLIFMRSKLHFCEVMRNDFRGFNSRRLHHFEIREKIRAMRIPRG
jgi:hypothetical protein